MQTIVPPFLKQGDTIGIVATARWLNPEQLQPALDIIHSWGFKTKIGKHVYTQNFQLAGSDEQRTKDLQLALNDDEVKAILIARGGYGTVRTLHGIDFSGFQKNPKWLCGYSDVTVLHAELNKLGFATIHSTMPVSFPVATSEALESLRLALTGELKEVEWPTSLLNAGQPIPHTHEPMPLLGGNLSVLCSVLGSSFATPDKKYILFLEDVDEMLYHVDRMMMALMRAFVFDRMEALIIGGLTQMKDNTAAFGFPDENPWGHAAEQTMKRFGEMLKVPVYSGFPAGHQNDNRAFYLGRNVSLQVNDGPASLKYI